MEDFKLILYVLAAVAYFIFMQWRKAFNAPKDDADAVPRTQERRPQMPARPATSFEDILRELQPKLEQAEAKKQEVVETTKQLTQPHRAPLPPVLEKKPLIRNYEDVAPKALSWEKPAEAMQAARNSEQLRIGKRFEAFEKEKAAKSRYASLLRNPATVRDAVILSEIFNRKYN